MPDIAGPVPAQATIASAVPIGTPKRPFGVLHIYRRFTPDYTGDGIYFTKLTKYFRQHSIESEVLATDTTADPGAALANDNSAPSAHYLGPPGFWTAPKMLLWLLRNRHRFDVIHIHSHVDRWFLFYAIAKLFGVRLVFSASLADSAQEIIQTYRPYKRVVARQLLRIFDRFVVISPRLLRLSLGYVSRDKLYLIPQGVECRAPTDVNQRSASRMRLGLGLDEFVLLNVGAVIERKNQQFLIEVLAGMKSARKRLIVIGPVLEETYHRQLQEFAVEHGMADQVLFTGFVDDPHIYYQAADVLVFASHSEGFPNVFLEAMASGLPIVSTTLDGLTDHIIQQGVTGFLASGLGEFIHYLDTMTDDPGLAIRMGQTAREVACRSFRLGDIADCYSALYLSASKKRWTRKAPELKRLLPRPDLDVSFCSAMSAGPEEVGFEPIQADPADPPTLIVVIDVEAEFNWASGTLADHGEVSNIAHLVSGLDPFLSRGLKPALMVDWPVATHDQSAATIQQLAHLGCAVGVHMQAWTTPPFVEVIDDWNSFSGNLGAPLEKLKIQNLMRRLEDVTGGRPTLFKAGRYGVGPNTLRALEELGFKVDCSVCPYFDYSARGGPDFTKFDCHPAWFGKTGRLLSVPTTSGLAGGILALPLSVQKTLWKHVASKPIHRRLCGRFGLLHPHRLSPEGNSFAELRQVTLALHGQGVRLFTLSLHSPSFIEGHTPYVKTANDVSELRATLSQYLDFFVHQLGGRFSTPAAVYAELAQRREMASAACAGQSLQAGSPMMHEPLPQTKQQEHEQFNVNRSGF